MVAAVDSIRYELPKVAKSTLGELSMAIFVAWFLGINILDIYFVWNCVAKPFREIVQNHFNKYTRKSNNCPTGQTINPTVANPLVEFTDGTELSYTETIGKRLR